MAARERAVRVARRHGRRRHVVEEAVVLVVIDQQHGLAPYVRVRGQRVEHRLHVPRALRGARRPRMFAVYRRRDDPRHLGQRAVADVVTERFEEAMRHRVAETLRERAQRIVDRRIVERAGRRHRLRDVRRRDVRGAACGRHLLDGRTPVAEAHHLVAAEVVDQALVDLPVHAGLLQPVRVGRPCPALARGADVVAAVELVVQRGELHATAVGRADAVRAVGAAPVEQPVRDRARVHPAVVVVAQRERVGERALERHFGRVVIAHRQRRLRVGPAVHPAVVPCGLRVGPRMRRAARALCVALVRIEVVRRDGRRGRRFRVGLVEHVAAVRRRHREAVAVTAHALEGAEVAVEPAVFHHQQHDVLDVLDGPRFVKRGNRERAADARRKRGQRGGGEAGSRGLLKKFAA